MEFGNRLRQWTTAEFRRLAAHRPNQLPPLVSVRSQQAVDNTKVQVYRIPVPVALAHCRHWELQGYALLVDESAPDHCVEFQTEVMNSPRFVEMRYAVRSGLGMRQAYEHMRHTHGATAMALLRHFLDTPSMETLNRILFQYNTSVVELSVYPMAVGVLQWNTLFWEVRNW